MPFVGFQAAHRGNTLCCNSEPLSNTTPKQFWNGDFMKSVREKMLKGELVDACKSCYKAEAQGKVSLRSHYNSVYKDWDQQDTPLALDLDFSNFCNLQCVMCGPERSSQWAKELGEEKQVLRIEKSEIDELISMSDKLRHITIQGGEPSIMPEFQYLFEKLVSNGRAKDITIDCISNLTNVNNRFYQLLDHFKHTNLNVSIDQHGDINNYIRYPSNFHVLEKNLLSLKNKPVQASLQITLQTLSLIDFDKFLAWIEQMHKEFKSVGKNLGLSLSFVTSRDALNPFFAPNELKKQFISDIEKFIANTSSKFDVKFILVLKNLTKTFVANNKIEKKQETLDFVTKLDQRRGIKITDYIGNFAKYFSKKSIK